jgi:hypothetical protein
MRGTHDRSLPDDLVDILRDRLAELEDLEATGAGTPDTCEVLVAVCWLLAALDRKLHAGTTLH